MKLRTGILPLCMLVFAIACGNDAGEIPVVPVNAVLGDLSFEQRFGQSPNPGTDSELRIRTHLAYVEELLAQRDVGNWPEWRRAARQRCLTLLRAYRLAGRFPRVFESGNKGRPCFIDREGSVCALGYLVEQTVGRATAEALNEDYQFDYVADIHDRRLDRWLVANGLSKFEAAAIQPMNYVKMPDFSKPSQNFGGLTAGLEMALHRSTAPVLPPEVFHRNAAVNSSALNFALGLNFEYFFNEFTRDESVLLRFLYREANTDLAAELRLPRVDPDNPDDISYETSRFETDFDYNSIALEVLFNYFLAQRLSIGAGLSFDYILCAQQGDSWNITAGSGDEFSAGTRGNRIFGYPSPAINWNSTRLGLSAGLRYRLDFTKKWAISPSLTYNHGLTNVRGGEWQVHALRLGLDLQRPL